MHCNSTDATRQARAENYGGVPPWEHVDRLIANVKSCRASRKRPCPICGGPKYCVHDDHAAFCSREARGSVREVRSFGFLHVLHSDAPPRPFYRSPKPPKPAPADLHAQFSAVASRATLGVDLTPLAREFGVVPAVLEALGVGRLTRWRGEYWSAPIRYASGHVCGIGLRRVETGRKLVEPGTDVHGLYFAKRWDVGGEVFIVEGVSDVAACMHANLSVIGRTNNQLGGPELAKLLAGLESGRRIVVVAEADRKTDGRWPGRDGAEHLAREIAPLLPHLDIVVCFPPDGAKDARSWLQAQQGPPAEAGRRFLEHVREAAYRPAEADPGEAEKSSSGLTAPNLDKLRQNAYKTIPFQVCENPRSRILWAGGTDIKLRYAPCRCGYCPLCQAERENRRKRDFLVGVDALAAGGGKLYSQVLDPGEAAAAKRSVARQGGQFKCSRLPGGAHRIISNVPVSKGLRPVGDVAALKEKALTEIDQAPRRQGRIVTGSRKLPGMKRYAAVRPDRPKLPPVTASIEKILDTARRLGVGVRDDCIFGPFRTVDDAVAFVDECETFTLRPKRPEKQPFWDLCDDAATREFLNNSS